MILIVLSSLVGLMAAAPMVPASSNCCLANKFTATLLQLGAQIQHNSNDPDITDGYSVIDYDFDMQMMKLQMHKMDQNTGMMQTMDIWMDYNNSRVYSVIMGQCYVTMNQQPMTKPCVGVNSTFTGSHVIGTGANTVTIDGYMMMNMGMAYHMEVQRDTCTPVTYQEYGDNMDGSKMMNSYTFTDVKRDMFSMANPFDMPDSCKNAMQAPVGK